MATLRSPEYDDLGEIFDSLKETDNMEARSDTDLCTVVPVVPFAESIFKAVTVTRLATLNGRRQWIENHQRAPTGLIAQD